MAARGRRRTTKGTARPSLRCKTMATAPSMRFMSASGKNKGGCAAPRRVFPNTPDREVWFAVVHLPLRSATYSYRRGGNGTKKDILLTADDMIVQPHHHRPARHIARERGRTRGRRMQRSGELDRHGAV